LNNNKYLNFGLQLADSCAALYYGVSSLQSANDYSVLIIPKTNTGIGPEGFHWSPDGSNVPADQLAFYNKHVCFFYPLILLQNLED